jgi:Na+-transporting NADH:ubiquinone oxidoreductase subunit C
MGLNKNSNGYTFGFAFVMVAVVGAILASLAMGLKPLQQQNVVDKKKMEILSAVGVKASRAEVSDLFDKYIVEQVAINYKGEPLDGVDAFEIDVRKDFRNRTLKTEDKQFPLYVADKEGERLFVIPMVGTGLWGPIWGFVSLKDDYKTVYGASFNHKSETPGLGAEISSYRLFQAQFEGKSIKDGNGNFVSIEVKKGGAEKGNPNQVDGITGGTITSDGVTEMLERTFAIYNNYFEKKGSSTAEVSENINQENL